MMSKGFFIALLSVTSLNFTYLRAQDRGCTTRTVPVGVVDREWNFVQGLSTANFRGKFRGHDVDILSASIDTRPRHIVLLLDASGSMMEPDEGWKTAKSLSEDLIRFAPPRASIAQMAFSDNVLDTAGFDQDRSALLTRLATLLKVCEQPRRIRRTALYDAIASARATLGMPEFGDIIYAVTDGGDNKSRTEPKRVEGDLLRAGVRLFAVVTASGPGNRSRTPVEIGPDQLRSMAVATGGNVLTFPYAATFQPYPHFKAKTRDEAIKLALHRLYEQMGTFYRLDLRLPERVDKPTQWKLQVIGENGRPNYRVEVHYPHRLMPCAKTSP